MITLVTEPEDYSPKAIAVYEKLGRVYFLPRLAKSQKLKIFMSADILVVRLAHQISKKWIDQMPNLKIIATNTTGLNHIDMRAAAARQVKVISLRGRASFLKNITSTAELAVGLMVALVRNLPSAFDDVKQGQWERMGFRGHQLSGKTLGVIGYGRLGKLIAGYGRMLGMKVVAYDPFVRPTKSVDFVSLEKLFKTADVVSLQVLLTEKNRGFIKFKHFRMVKPTAYFINTARAELLEKDALYLALSKKIIAGAAIDVMDNEDSSGKHLKKDPLWKYAKAHHNLIITPHIGGATFEAMHITEEFIAHEVKKYLS